MILEADTIKRMKEYRTIEGLTQQDLADQMDLPLKMIQRYENGENKVTTDFMEAFAKLRGKRLDELDEQNDPDENAFLEYMRTVYRKQVREVRERAANDQAAAQPIHDQPTRDQPTRDQVEE